MMPPTNLNELIALIELRKKLVLEYDNKANEFTLISDNVKILGKINRKKFSIINTFIFIFRINDNYILETNSIEISEKIQIKYKQLFKVWNTYKNTLEDAKIMLKKKENEFMKSLMKKHTDLKIKAKDLLQTFLETAPISTEWNSNGN